MCARAASRLKQFQVDEVHHHISPAIQQHDVAVDQDMRTIRRGQEPLQVSDQVPAAIQEQLLKSISATLVVVAGKAFKGCAVASFAVVCSDGMQSGVPPLRGTAALESTVKSTSPAAGVE